MEIRSLISKFLTNLVEKNYAQANEQLKSIVESKTKDRIKNVMEILEGKSRKQPTDKFSGPRKPKHKTARAQKTNCKGKANCKCSDCNEEQLEEGAIKPADRTVDNTEAWKNARDKEKSKREGLRKYTYAKKGEYKNKSQKGK
jgi:hypothetical protein